MSEELKTEETLSLSQIVFNNLKELNRAKNAAHESIFKIHWKKMWPFNLIWPQVDFIRIMRLMDEIKKNCQAQKQLIDKEFTKAESKEIEFLKIVKPYLDSLANSAEKLSAVADYKQKLLEKKVKRSVFEFNRILKEYEDAQKDLVKTGAIVRAAWLDIA